MPSREAAWWAQQPGGGGGWGVGEGAEGGGVRGVQHRRRLKACLWGRLSCTLGSYKGGNRKQTHTQKQRVLYMGMAG